MSPKIKLGAYAILLILAVWFAWGFYSNYSAVSNAAKAAGAQDMDVAANPAPEAAPPPAVTNSDTNSTATTNTVTNVTAQATNAAAGASNAVATAAPPASPPAKTAANTKVAAPADVSADRGRMIEYLAAFVGAVIGLGVLIAVDVTQFMGEKAVDFLFNDKGEGIRDPEYERAEQEWANGKHLEAVQLLRDYLKKNPRQLHAALRIAEIYEKDLHNYLAAALEYEEVLKYKLPAERWAWAAIHLCNLYSRIGQPEKTLALLRRIVEEYPQTAAAKKARTRLGLPEPESGPGTEEATAEEATPMESAETGADSEAESEQEPPSNLPPGFRPKK